MEPRGAPIPERIAGARSRRQGAATALGALVLVVIVALVKPWGAVVPVGPAAAPTPQPATASSQPTGPPARVVDALSRACLEPSGWRVAATERWKAGPVRSWRAVEAVVASGPLDPRIPIVPVVGQSVPAVGFCAPVVGRDRPPRDARGSILRIAEDGEVSLVDVRRLTPPDDTSGGAIWAGPALVSVNGIASATWPVGRYVIRVATPDDRYERWIGLEILRPMLERADPSPSATIGG
jgi:hypothetical protein